MSVATAVSVWVPLLAVVVSQPVAYGENVTGFPSTFPSRKNWTEATPQSSAVLAATGYVPDTLSLCVGFLIPTVGNVVSFPPEHGVALDDGDRDRFRSGDVAFESVTRARRVWLPGDVPPTVQLNV